MKVQETVKPNVCVTCGRPPECPCFEKFHDMRSTCLYNYYQAILRDDATTAPPSSRVDTQEPQQRPTRSTSQSRADKNYVEELIPPSRMYKVTCPRCLKTYEDSISGKTTTGKICDHCRLKAQGRKLESDKVKKLDGQKEDKRRISRQEQKEDRRHILRLRHRSSSDNIDLQLLRTTLAKRLKTKEMFRSGDNLLDPKKNVDFKISHEIVEIYQSSSFRPVSNVTISDTKFSKNEVQSEGSKLKPHHVSEKEKFQISNKPLSEPTLLTLGREEKLTNYQNLMQSEVNKITGYDIEKGMVYYFPKVERLELKRHVSTSELIRDTREKHGTKFDEETKRLEDEESKRLEKLSKEREAEEKRRLARERWEKAKEKNKLTDKSKSKERKKTKESKAPKGSKEPEEKKEPKEPKEKKEPKEPKEKKEPKEAKESKESSKEKKEMEQKKKSDTNEKKGKEISELDKLKKNADMDGKKGNELSEIEKLRKVQAMQRPRDEDKASKLAALLLTLHDVNEKERVKVKPPKREPPLKSHKTPGKRPKTHKLQEAKSEGSLNSFNAKKVEIEDIVIGENICKYKPPDIPQDPNMPGSEEDIAPMLFKTKHLEEQLEGSATAVKAFKKVSEDKRFNKRTETQLKKCWENLKTRQKTILAHEKRQRMMTGGGSYTPTHPGSSIEIFTPEILIPEALSQQTNVELTNVIDSDTGFIYEEVTMALDEQKNVNDDSFVSNGSPALERGSITDTAWYPTMSTNASSSFDKGPMVDTPLRPRSTISRLSEHRGNTSQEANAQQRFVVYSNGEPDERGRSRPVTVLASFDYLGNGVVFDHSGKIRLKYNQTDGIVLDRGIGPVSHWKWHTLNDPPVLQQVMIDTQIPRKDPIIWNLGGPGDFKNRPDNEEMLAIEFDNFIKEKSKKMSQSFKPFQIKMKALKINEQFSLKVLDQATVYLIFRDGTTNLKQNIGMVLDPQEIVDTDTAELGIVANSLERLPARTQSIAALQASVTNAQHYEKMRTERERRLRPQVSCVSVDRLTAARSRPMRHVLQTLPTAPPASMASVGGCECGRKSSNSLYYDNRLV